MSSYSSFDNKPISQLKVTELKEELKKRKLTTKGLKEDLVRRLDEALRIERENTEREKQEENGTDSGPQSVVEGDNVESVSQSAKDVDKKSGNDEKMDDVRVKIDINESLPPPDQPVQEGGHVGVGDSGKGEENVSTTIVEESTKIVAEVASSEQDQPTPEKKENGDSEIQMENEDSEHQREIDDVKPSLEDAIPDSAAPNNQVSEVSPTLGFQVKSDSISTDSLSINEKNEFKDNIIADNIKLELDVIKPEMVEPSSSNVVPVDGKSHPMDVEEPHENKVAVEDKEDEKSTKADLNKSNETADVSYSEKLNLDRSSGDDSMEEDLPESKHIELKHNEVEVRDSNEKTEVTVLKEEIPGHIVGDVEKKDDVKVENIEPTTLAEKRKHNDQGGSGSNESIKRQRKWKAETLKVHEAQGSSLSPLTTPKEALLTPTLRRNFTRSDSTASDDTPKERVVPPSQKPPTNSLRIDRFLRPFTLKAVEELLGKTGTVKSFWMDHIKTHCYVTYSSVEEAAETRNAVYNLQWPPNGGRLLVADFVDPQEVKSRAEAPPSVPGAAATAPPTGPAATTQPTTQPQPSPRNQAGPPKQQLPPPPLPPPPPAQERERVHLPPPPPLSDKADPTIVTLDVLFKKTKATPRIYYLPLTDEQVSAKLEGRGRPTRL